MLQIPSPALKLLHIPGTESLLATQQLVRVRPAAALCLATPLVLLPIPPQNKDLFPLPILVHLPKCYANTDKLLLTKKSLPEQFPHFPLLVAHLAATNPLGLSTATWPPKAETPIPILYAKPCALKTPIPKLTLILSPITPLMPLTQEVQFNDGVMANENNTLEAPCSQHLTSLAIWPYNRNLVLTPKPAPAL